MVNSKLIVNADDFANSVDVINGITMAFQQGLINQTTILVNMPFVEEAVSKAKEAGFFDKIGLHLNLTEGSPLTADISRCERICENGQFKGTIIADLRHGVRLTKEEKHAVVKEIHAQIDKYVELGFPLMHIDSHHHLHNEWPILNIIIPYAKEKGFKSMRIARNLIPLNSLQNVVKKTYKYFLNNKIQSSFDTTQYFGSMGDYLSFRDKIDGRTEVMVHPISKDGIVYDIVAERLIPLCKVL
jgi:hypothetical protein